MDIQQIRSQIHDIRGYKVMLDFDLASLYDVETRVLNQSVKRNTDNFPPDFMFQLAVKEWEQILSEITLTVLEPNPNSSQFVMSSKKHRGKAYTP
ncbi:MAG TPA: ORF6N domain-containing protein [Sediminibacterium sp.]